MEQVCYKAVATGGGIGEVRLFQNGKLIKSDGFYREAVAKDKSGEAHVKLASIDSAAVTRALKLTKSAQQADVQLATNSKGNEYTECQEVETIPGDNEISVAAFNANNTIQSSLETMHFTADRKAEDPHLYVLGIGIDKYTASENNLSFAVKDATDFRTTIQAKAKGLYKDGNIHIEGLSDAQATKASIQKAIAAISTQVKPWDSFILFVASHGHLQGNQYYIVTSDFDGVVDTSKMISSNEIVGMSKNIKSLSQLLIFDTCHAGGVDNIIGGLYDARMSVMAKKMGLHIYASAGSTQTALDGYQGNGLFTHALLDSMKTADKTDSNHDKEVSVAELGESAKQETLEISTKLGSPQTPNIINFGKDNPVFRLGEKTVVAAYCPLCPDMATIPAGSFNMGSSNGRSDEKPQHRVSFAKPFSIGKTEVTQAQWRAIMGGNPSQHKGCDSCPVEQVSWDDAQAYIKELNAKTGRQYRLPSEAEWEYACRAGGQHEFCGSDAIESISWYGGHTPDIPQPGQPDKSTGNSRNNTHPVATKQANAWGVYDMTGNVAEWVEDSYHGKYKSGVTDGSYNGAPSDGSVWAGDGLFHVCRGGDYYGMSWKGEAATELARAARRDLGRPNKIEFDLGFRLASDEVMENRNAAK
jgi:formylglycine-generating enzyme required for sulfatase activity